VSCQCSWCVPATAIAKRHADSTRRVRAEERTDAIAKSVGIDLAKARQRKREEDSRMVHVINKSAGMATDPNWERMLSVHAAAAAGDPAAMSAWAATEMSDPGVAKLVPEVARIRQPKASKRRPDTGGPGTEWTYVPRRVAEKRARKAFEQGDDLDEAEFMASLERSGALNKSAGSRGTPRRGLEQVDNDPEFAAFVESVDRNRRRF
jgi:hypothetical protein